MLDHVGYVRGRAQHRNCIAAGAGAAGPGAGRRFSRGHLAHFGGRDRNGVAGRGRPPGSGRPADAVSCGRDRAAARYAGFRRARPVGAVRVCLPGAVLRADAARPRRGARVAGSVPSDRSLRYPCHRGARRCSKLSARRPDPEIRSIAEIMDRGGWLWASSVLAALPPAEPRTQRHAAGLRVWTRLAEWSETAPPPMPGNEPVMADEARARLARLLGADAEPRPQQSDYAAAAAAAFAPRDMPDRPHAVLAEAGTGVGKTLGYIAPASLWAEKNGGAVWISTFTRNLQTQISGELDRLYPDPAVKRRRVVVRKGRENFLCLLNYEEALTAAASRAGTRRGAARAGRALDCRNRGGRPRRRRFPGLACRADRPRTGQRPRRPPRRMRALRLPAFSSLLCRKEHPRRAQRPRRRRQSRPGHGPGRARRARRRDRADALRLRRGPSSAGGGGQRVFGAPVRTRGARIAALDRRRRRRGRVARPRAAAAHRRSRRKRRRRGPCAGRGSRRGPHPPRRRLGAAGRGEPRAAGFRRVSGAGPAAGPGAGGARRRRLRAAGRGASAGRRVWSTAPCRWRRASNVLRRRCGGSL